MPDPSQQNNDLPDQNQAARQGVRRRDPDLEVERARYEHARAMRSNDENRRLYTGRLDEERRVPRSR